MSLLHLHFSIGLSILSYPQVDLKLRLLFLKVTFNKRKCGKAFPMFPDFPCLIVFTFCLYFSRWVHLVVVRVPSSGSCSGFTTSRRAVSG